MNEYSKETITCQDNHDTPESLPVQPMTVDGGLASSTESPIASVSITTLAATISYLGEWALWYASHELAVIQLSPKSKIPRKGSHGYKDATTAPAVIRSLWSEIPDGNVAAATGVASGFTVVDADGTVGWKTLVDLQSRLGTLPVTVTVVTPGKIEDKKHTGQGYHFYFRLPDGVTVKSKNGIADHVDIKAEGGYIVLPPSVHPDGTGIYQFAEGMALGQIPIAVLPPMWVDFLVATTTKKNSTAQPSAESEKSIPLHTAEINILDEPLRKRIIAYIDECDGAIQGKKGHSTLLSVANSLVHGFCLEPSVAADLAWQHYNPKCTPSWTEAERHDFDRKFNEAHNKPPNKLRGWLLDSTTPASSVNPGDIVDGRVILDTELTRPTAKALIEKHFTVDGVPILHYLGEVFYSWRDNAYRQIENVQLRAELLHFLHEARIERVGKKGSVFCQFPAKKSHVDAAFDAVKGVAFLPSSTPIPCWLGEDIPLVNNPSKILFGKTRNLNLETMQTFAPSPKWFNYNALDFDYVEYSDKSLSPCPRWDIFLTELFGEDVESKQTLLQFMGLLLTSETKFQKALFLVGAKRSGKGTIARVIRKLVGELNVAAPTTDGLASHFGLQTLIGKTVAIVPDARFNSQNQSILTERILTITGEDSVTVDRKFLGAVTLRLPTRFLFLSNELPRLTDSSGALASRFIILKLTKSFYGKEDIELEGKLLAELPGILHQAVVALRDLLKRGYFVQPQSANDAVEMLAGLTSPVGRFVRDRCDTSDAVANFFTTSDILYEAWRQWCSEEGIQGIGTKDTFFRNLIAAVPGLVKKRATGFQRPWGYEGIALKLQNSSEG